MSHIEKCKSEPPVTVEYIEGQLANGRGSSAAVTRMLVGMIARGEGFKSNSAPKPKPKAREPKAPPEGE